MEEVWDRGGKIMTKARGSSEYQPVPLSELCDLVQTVIEKLCGHCPDRDNCGIYKAFGEEDG
jgi:hypothetical protein